MKNLIRTYFKILSAIAPRLAGKQAFELFQRPINKKVRQKDKALYNYATLFSVPYPGKIVFYLIFPYVHSV